MVIQCDMMHLCDQIESNVNKNSSADEDQERSFAGAGYGVER